MRGVLFELLVPSWRKILRMFYGRGNLETVDPFSEFSEWATEADEKAFRDL